MHHPREDIWRHGEVIKDAAVDAEAPGPYPMTFAKQKFELLRALAVLTLADEQLAVYLH
jgi:hypothetical protein